MALEGFRSLFKAAPSENPPLTREQLEALRVSAEMQQGLLAYQEEWSKKAQAAGLTSSNPDVLAFNRARGEVWRLAGSYAEKDLTEEERSGLSQLIEQKKQLLEGSITARLQEVIQERENPKDFTLREKKEKLVSSVEELEAVAEEKKAIEEPAVEKVVVEEPIEQKEVREEVAKSLKEKVTVNTDSLPQREALLTAENSYLAAYKDFYRQKGAKEEREPEELKTLKRAYDEARIEYGTALTDSAIRRLETRGDPAREPTAKDLKIIERYNRLVRYNEIIKPAAEKKYNARIEAMGEREKGIFSKGLSWVGSQNKKLENKFGKTGAKFVRAAATTIVVGGGAAAVGAFGTAGLLGALGWGTFRFGRSIASSFAGAGAGELAAQAYGSLIGKGKQEKAAANLAYVGRTGELLTIEKLEEYDTSRLILEKRVDERTLEREKVIVRAITALGVGAGTSAFLSHLPSAEGGAGELSSAVTKTPGELANENGFSANMSADKFEDYVRPNSSVANETISIPKALDMGSQASSLELAVGATIHQAGEGTDQLFGELKTAIQERGLWNAGQQSAGLKHFMETNPNELSRSMGKGFGEVGMKTQLGDQFFVDEHQNVWYQPLNGEPQAFIENNPQVPGGFAVHQLQTNSTLTGEETPIQAPKISPVTPEQLTTPEPTFTPTPEVDTKALEVVDSKTTSEIIANRVTEQSTVVDQTAYTQTQESVPAVVSSHTEALATTSAEILPQDGSPIENSLPIPGSSPDTLVNGGRVFKNAMRIPVDPLTPHTYEMKGMKGAVRLWGGTPTQKDEFMATYFSKPENDGKMLWITMNSKSSLTGEPVTLAFTAQGTGGTVVLDSKGLPLKPPAVDAFIRREL